MAGCWLKTFLCRRSTSGPTSSPSTVGRPGRDAAGAHLDRNALGEKAGTAIGRALETNNALRKLDLAANSLGPEAGAAIGSGLVKNQTLTDLQLYSNGLGDAGGAAIGDALATNSTLLKLDISNTKMGPEGLAGIVRGLERNTTLQELLLLAEMPDELQERVGALLACNGQHAPVAAAAEAEQQSDDRKDWKAKQVAGR